MTTPRAHYRANGRPKTAHLSEQADRAHAQRLLAITGKHVSVYRCPLCHEWHVGRPTVPRSIP